MPLRAIEEKDLEAILRWRNSDEVRLNMFSQSHISLEQHRSWFNNIKQDKTCVWWVYEDSNGEPSGVVYFTDIDTESSLSFWGFYMAPEALKGLGSVMGTEALFKAFTELNLKKIYGDVLVFNERSQRFHEKLGFKKENYMRAHHKIGETYYDVVRYGLLNNEWI